MLKKPKDRLAKDIHVGLSDEFEREIGISDVLEFAKISGDMNPLHIDENYAKKTKFKHRIVHGAFQIGLASEWIGMYLPGLRVLLSTVNAKFIAPLYYPCRVRVLGHIISWDSISNNGSAKIIIIDMMNSNPTAEIIMGFTLHEVCGDKALGEVNYNVVASDQAVREHDDKKVILLLGASGAIGTALAMHLAGKYSLICQGRDVQKLKELQNLFACDILPGRLGNNFGREIDVLLRGRGLYGVIYGSWPPPPKGGLLEMDEAIIADQINFGSSYAINFAKLLFEKCDPKVGGRFIALGSTISLEKNTTTPAYAIGKSLLEETVKTISSEMARKNITANIVSPSLVPVGMNSRVQDATLNRLVARVPLGRLCSESDILSAVDYFLSKESSFVSGQTLALTGAV